MKLKICGMKYNTLKVARLQPDYLGFIFYNKSSRFYDDEIPEISSAIKKTGVFVNTSIKDIINAVNTHNLDAIQLHGQESIDFVKNLRKTIIDSAKKLVEIIKVFSVKDQFDFSVLKPYENSVDYFLFDTKGELPGGNGYVFDWSVLENYPSTTPYFLSGGIGLDCLEQLKKFQESPSSKYCYALDVNSKFESKPGLKKIDELEKFKHELQH